MSWLRLLRGTPGPAAVSDDDLELALERPERHVHVLLDLARQPRERLHDVAVARLVLWPPRLWFRVDALRLDDWYGGRPLMPARYWRNVIADTNAGVFLLVLASTHGDGFLREAAVLALRGRREPLAAAALSVRSADHVPQVREAARSALFARAPGGEAAVVVPILYAARARHRSGDLLDPYLGRLAPETQATLLDSHDRDTRRYVARRGPFTPTDLMRAAASHDDTYVRLIAAQRALTEDPSVAADLLEFRTASVRALAVAAAPDSVLLPRLQQLLLDRSPLLRRAAQARARSAGYDARSLYRRLLPQRSAVLGLGETGEPVDVESLVSLVFGSVVPSIRRAAIVGLGGIAAGELLRELLPKLLYDDEAAVAREAARQLRRIRFALSGPDLERALHAPNAWTRQTALGMALRLPGWSPPLAALTLYDDSDEGLREYARATLNDWLGRSAATAGAPSADQAAQLHAALAQIDLDPWRTRLLRFHAGIRPGP
jgi:hypothetical protein